MDNLLNWKNRWFRCRKCSKFLRTPGTFLRHKRTECNDKLVSTRARLTSMRCKKLESGRYSEQQNGYRCQHCSKFFLDLNRMKQHKLTHVGVHQKLSQRNKCSVNLTNENQLTAPAHLNREKSFNCEKCGSPFVCSADLERHLEVHSDGKPFKCGTCEFSCKKASGLKQHFLNRHSSERPFECEVCSYKCKLKQSLKQHMLAHINSEKPFKCQLCNYETRSFGSLKTHNRRHTQEKQFKCQFCDYTSIFPWNLKIHAVVHSDEKPFKCDQCDFSSKHSTALHRHKITHGSERPFKCDFCSHSTKRSSALKEHIRTHTGGEKPFKCQQCEYAAYKPGQLRQHVLSHSKTKDSSSEVL